MTAVQGLHHITAIAGDAQQNLDFYVGVLGMRLVKRSVNQDDPGTYHLFYADGEGHPGTDLTFFPWPRLAPRRQGVGLNVEVPLAVPEGSLEYWHKRLEHYGAEGLAEQRRFGERTLTFLDPHGLELALVETADERLFAPWDESPVPAPKQVRGLHAARLWERDLSKTEAFLTSLLGFKKVAEEDGWHRYAAAGGGSGKYADVREVPDGRLGQWGTGSVHHVAWTVEDTEHETALQQRLAEAGWRPTEIIDRFWFKSVYFREPGGVLFELATRGPGFAVDEAPERLGETLVLPPWLEPNRREIEAALPPLTLPVSTSS